MLQTTTTAKTPGTSKADSMAETLSALVGELSQLASSYVPSAGHDAASLAPKAALINASRKIMYSLMDPGMMVQAHSLQMAELVSVRTLLDLKVFEKFPANGTITGKELSEKSGVQQALLGRIALMSDHKVANPSGSLR